jgi:hypothetical protein
MTKDSEHRLPRLVSQLYEFADEVIIGVDASSRDNTWKVARQWGDRVYRFRLRGQTGPARQLVFDYATGDWIFSIDDDELVEDDFGSVVRDLIAKPGITHALFPRKRLVGVDPCAFAYAPPWYPDWQLRLFRNDRMLAHKPSRLHTGYWVSGPGIWDPRAAILHFGPMEMDDAARVRKADFQRKRGFDISPERFLVPNSVPSRPARMPEIGVRRPSGRGLVFPKIHSLPRFLPPEWRADILSIDCVGSALPNGQMTATIRVRNSGSLAWMPRNGRLPVISLGLHLKDEAGAMLRNGWCLFSVTQPVLPNTVATFIVPFRAPETSGRYVFEWDMVSEGECWFAQLGGTTLANSLIVNDDETVARSAPINPVILG